MDPALKREKEAFKKKLIAAADKSQRSREEAAKAKASVQAAPPAKKAKKKHSHTVNNAEILDRIKSAAQTAHRSDNPHRVLKSIMDMMKERYIGRNYEYLSLDEILVAIELTTIKPDLRLWIQDALGSNPKIHHEEGRYLFKPALGHGVCTRKQLLAKLCENERMGLGGLTLSDIKEAVYSHEKVIKRLVDEECVICISRQDKEQVVFYNNPEYALRQPVSEEFQGLWHCVSVEGMTEVDIEKYLENVGLGAMQGESRKRKVPGTSSKKTRKKAKLSKVMNTHLDNELLKDYTDDAAPPK